MERAVREDERNPVPPCDAYDGGDKVLETIILLFMLT
jgi:hypothetical protein